MSDAHADADELAKTLARLLDAHAAHHDSFVMAPGATIDPARALGDKPTLNTLGARGRARIEPRSGLELGKTLGQGGMGVVREAKQLALDRDVAVKTVQPKLQSELTTRMLLQEALILGRLEHPNIVPVYDIRHDAGEPRIVLKKIEGIEWSTLVHRPKVVRDEFGAPDPLEWNLGILMTVCNAVHFAHSRGFVHRDLKPDNVMIGEFGEVYVMDWGLALCLHDDGSDRFPLARDARDLAGTPQYMAPEMLGGAGMEITARTDVYLLGAMLYEVIAGGPPHRGKDMREMMGQVVISRPAIPASCPAELSRICVKAMHKDPARRFESADALRDALAEFVRHAGSRRLAEQAEQRASELATRSAAGGTQTVADHERIQTLFGECRFAYQQALESWPRNELARTGLLRTTCAMIEYELRQNNPRSAGTLLASLDATIDPQLRARVDAALAELGKSERRMADLERLEKQLDLRTGSRNRAIGAGVLGLIWSIAPALAPLSTTLRPELGRLPIYLFLVGVLAAIGIWAVLAQRELRESSVTRRLMRAAAVAMLGQLTLEAVALVVGIDPVVTETLWPLIWFCVSAMLVTTVDRRLTPMTFGFLGAVVACSLLPAYRFHAMFVSNLIMTVNMFSVWMPWRELFRRG
jgi:eukaryotic-like serine/threonine-protein kinase